MIPVKFPEQNCTCRREGCMDLPTYREYNYEFASIESTSCWEFTEKEVLQMLNAIQSGKRPHIYLSVIGGQPPVSLFIRSGENEGFKDICKKYRARSIETNT